MASSGETEAPQTYTSPHDPLKHAGHTGRLVIEVYPVLTPGVVHVEVRQDGPVTLTRAEAISLLHTAAAQLQRNGAWGTELCEDGHAAGADKEGRDE